MSRLLRRWMIVGLVAVLLAGPGSAVSAQATDGGGEPSDTSPPLAPEVSAPPVSADSSRAAPGDSALTAPDEARSGPEGSLTVGLTEGEESEGDESDGESPPTVGQVEGEVLSDEEIRAVIDRLPPWDNDDSGAVGFKRPVDSLPPPRTGKTVDQPFPAGPGVAAPATDPGPLEILRVQPEGEVDIAPFVSITFNQPMVPLATVGQLDEVDPPVKLTPPLPGRWQWIGTRTLRFEHDQEIFDRLPMATSYVLEVPAGTESQSGGELAETFRAEFETPPPGVVRLIPDDDTLGLEPIFLATFDQRIEPAAVLDAITLLADGQERELRPASAAEIEGADYSIRYYAERALEGTWVAFRPAVPIDPDSALEITVGPHVPSAEGPNTSENSETVEARTYGPLRIVDTECYRYWYSELPCGPNSSLSVWFNNRLDAATVNAADFSITPEIPGVRVSVSGDRLYIARPKVGGTVYKVVIPATVGDVFGQTLGEPETVEFEVEEERPRVWFLGGLVTTLDPFGAGQTIPLIVRRWEQLRVRLYDVDPSDYESYIEFEDDFPYVRDPAEHDLSWPLIAEKVIDTGIDHDDLTEVPLDLSGALNGEHGHLVMIVEGAGRHRETADYWTRTHGSSVLTWVQDTDIGVDLVTGNRDVAVWTTDLRTGDPLADVEIRFGVRGSTLVSDGNGLARASFGTGGFDWVVASLGADRAVYPADIEAGDDRTIWYITDDRGVYRPGETVNLKGWVRNLDVNGDGDLEFLPEGAVITYTAVGPLGNDLGSGEIRTDGHGGFDLTIELSEGANLGWIWIEFRLPGATGYCYYTSRCHQHSFQVEEFRRPEFEVEARLESAGPHFIDESPVVAVDARYYSGGPVPNAEVNWGVITRQTSYSPPNWSGFTFGVWRPWWYFHHWSPSYEVETFFGTTDAAGSHYLHIDIEDGGDHLPTAVMAEAQVLDVNRQRWASTTGFLVHSADLYVGIRSARTFVRAGDRIDIEAVVTDLDGNPVAGRPFEVTKERLVSRRVDGEWVEDALDAETCEVTSRQVPVDCAFATGAGGRYRITARVVDDSGRTNRSEMTRWVTGEEVGVPSRNIELEAVNLIPSAETYAAGDIAEILVVSPFASGTGLLTVAHNEIIEARSFEITDHAAVLEVPITEDHVPALRLQVDLASTVDRTSADGAGRDGTSLRPAHASGEMLLRIPPVQRTLDVTAAPASAVVQPGAATSVTVEVNDAGGAPVRGANVLVIVVDEAVLALSGYELIDPIDVFYRPRAARLDAARSRSRILLEDPHWLPEQFEESGVDMGPAADAASDGGGIAPGRVAVRENLDALALFEPDALTDARGRVTVEFDLPDNLTRYRVMAVVVDGADRFGVAESSITARLPLQVRPSAPRFLNFGDEFELPIVVQNQTDSAMEVDVVVQTSNLELVGSAGRRILVPANDRVEVRFAARTDSAGTARFRAAAVSCALAGAQVVSTVTETPPVAFSEASCDADAQVVSLPVYTPATSEAFATYGVVDQGAVIQPVTAPEDVFPQFGGLEINTSSTALQALTDAVLYVARYPYRSSDAYASQIMAISALRDVLAAFEAEGLAGPDELDATVRYDIAQLSSLQKSDGGFPWLSRQHESFPYASIQVMHALVIARNEGFEVPPRVMERGHRYLGDIERRLPDDYSLRSRDMLMAYALHVRWLDGQQAAHDARALWERRGEALELDALAWLWPVVDDDGIEAEIERILKNRAVETPGAATFATDYGEDAYLLLHSSRRADGIVLDALITMAPTSDLIPKVVTGLLAHRVRGRWRNVQENTFILLALGRYFDTFEATEPDFVARVWFGDLYAAEHTYGGRSTDRGSTLVPMAELLDAGDSDLVVQKDGEGRLYYRLSLRYAPDDLDLEPLDRGFVVERSYEAVGDPGDVWLDDDGVWHVRAGAEVRVKLTMFNDSRRTMMVLIDPLAAGFEPLNPALAVTGSFDARGGGWGWTWYQHQNLRDDRAEAFSTYLRAGTRRYSYVVRATTPGTFVVPPARAEEIYAPEVFGRSGTDRVIVHDTR
ncbi:MAG: MG2 domain-containing protein [bacterium]|nr:MG2 domain-containing protein [bacterium]